MLYWFVLFSTVAAPLYILTNNAQGFYFFQYTHQDIRYFLFLFFSHPNGWEVVSHGFGLHLGWGFISVLKISCAPSAMLHCFLASAVQTWESRSWEGCALPYFQREEKGGMPKGLLGQSPAPRKGPFLFFLVPSHTTLPCLFWRKHPLSSNAVFFIYSINSQ